MPTVFTSFMMGSVVVDVTLTSAARLFRAVSKSWLLQASTWARAMATAGESGWVGIGSSPWHAVTGLRYCWSRRRPAGETGRRQGAQFPLARPSVSGPGGSPEREARGGWRGDH